VNDDLAEAIARYPTRFAGFASLPVADPAAAAKELERAVTQLKFKGAMIQGVSQGASSTILFSLRCSERPKD